MFMSTKMRPGAGFLEIKATQYIKETLMNLPKAANVKEIFIIAFAILTVSGCSKTNVVGWRYRADIDGDRQAEIVNVADLNGNGRADKRGDLHIFGQGDSLQGWLWSKGVEGGPDELRIYIDRNKDGRIETEEGWLWRCLDLDGDGICNDRDSDLHELDLTGKGFVHQRIRYRDIDGDNDPDFRCDYPALFTGERHYEYITSDRCMRQTWRGPIHGFGYWIYFDTDDDNLFPEHYKPGVKTASVWDVMDADGAGTGMHRVRRVQEARGIGLEGRRTTGEAHRWYDFNGDGFTDMHFRDYGPGLMRWSFDWDGDAPDRYSLDDPVKSIEAHVDYDAAFHMIGEVPRGWWSGDQLKFWDFLSGIDLPEYYQQRGSGPEFGRDFVPAESCVYYTLHAPWKVISLNWLEDQEDASGTKDVGCPRLEGIWSYYYGFEPKLAFIGSRRDFDRDADSDFRLYLSPIDGLYHLYEAEDGIWYRDTDCRRPFFMLRPTKENIQKYVREIITYSDIDDDGFFDTFGYDRDLDGTAEQVISKPEADEAELTDVTKIWRCGEELKKLYYPGPEDVKEVDFEVQVVWGQSNNDITARVKLSSSRPLAGYKLWLRAEEHVDYNILSKRQLRDGRSRWEFTEKIPRAQFILPGATRVTALLVNNVGRIVGSKPAGEVEVKPLNGPSLLVGFYNALHGKSTREGNTFSHMGQEEQVSTGDWIKLEAGIEIMGSREMTMVFEPFLTDETKEPRWVLGKKVYRISTGEMVASATLELVGYGDEVLSAAGSEVDSLSPISLEDYLGVRESGDRVYIPVGRTYRLGFRLYIDNRLIADRILYYDWLKEAPQTVYVKE